MNKRPNSQLQLRSTKYVWTIYSIIYLLVLSKLVGLYRAWFHQVNIVEQNSLYRLYVHMLYTRDISSLAAWDDKITLL
jgi:glycopeptide antibiotics resistance protein